MFGVVGRIDVKGSQFLHITPIGQELDGVTFFRLRNKKMLGRPYENLYFKQKKWDVTHDSMMNKCVSAPSVNALWHLSKHSLSPVDIWLHTCRGKVSHVE